MTPKFTTPCYVRVDDKDKRKEVCEKLKEMGYVMNFLPKTLGFSTRNSVLVNGRPFYGEYREPSCFLQNHKAWLAKSAEIDGWQFVDCGTNVELFLALASMRSDTDKGQWFISLEPNGMWRQFGNETPTHRWRRATATEIVEYFNKK